MNAGARLRSVVCDCEVVVVRASDTGVVQCGGVEMVAIDAPRPPVVAALPGFDGGTLLGKRYADATGSLEVLCTKPGQGSLSWAGELLEQRSARALPASD